jgi:hypothetical protein
MPIIRAFFYIPFRVPRQGAPTPGSLHRAPIETDAPFLEPPFNYFSEFPVNGTPMSLNRALVEKGAHLQSLLKSPADESPANSPAGPPQNVISIL